MTVAGHFNISLSDVRQMRLWEFNLLIDSLDSKTTKQPPEPGMVPVMD